MKHIVCFSGGVDSTALILWARENLESFSALFCDTGWEHPLTYEYIEQINMALLGGEMITVRSARYADGMRSLVQLKGRVPSAKARFCTENLKVKPMIEYVKAIDDEVTIYQGIRADESLRRAMMKDREWSDDYDAYVERPLFRRSKEWVFALLAAHSVSPNPLYLLGAHRVGCFPCVMVNHRELRALMRNLPEVKERIRDLEEQAGRSFFPPGYIPERFQTGFDEKSQKPYPKSDDVFRYIESSDENQLPLFAATSCMSIYNLCE
jgi:3'-phosphoadenosine 5'-phosphosulfate sulfotransferase (PAPS reductase)/FAD synthetase